MISLTKFKVNTSKGAVLMEQRDNGMIIAQFITGQHYPASCCYDRLRDIDDWIKSYATIIDASPMA